MSKTLQGQRTELNKTNKNKQKQTKGQNRRQSVVAGRQQLCCAVQSRSPNHCQTTTEKVQSSALMTERRQRLCIPDSRCQSDSANDHKVIKPS